MKTTDLIKDNSLSINEEIVNLFFETFVERHMIWYRRFVKQDAVWTDDKIFQTYKFTNVYRELDRNTQWEIKHILQNQAFDLKELVWRIFVFRLINNIKTFDLAQERFGWQDGIMQHDVYDADQFAAFLDDVRDNYFTPFTSAYLIANKKGEKQTHLYANYTFTYINEHLDDIITMCKNVKTPREILDYMQSIPAVGRFNAYQLYIDLTYIDVFSNKHLFNFKKSDDCNIGPGSSLGCKMLFPSVKMSEVKDKFNYLAEIAESKINAICAAKNIEKFPYVDFNEDGCFITDKCTITITEIEHWLCEFQKYYSRMNNVGKAYKKFVQTDTCGIINIKK